MNYLKQVQNGIDFIEANLGEHFSLPDVAQAAGMSQWHFQRIFKALTNETLKAYIRSRRIANSLEELLSSKASILDIALNAGFESNESYTRAFQKMFNLSPSEYRRRAEKSLILRKAQFDLHYLENLTSNVLLKPEIYSTGERYFVGLSTYFYGIDSEKNNIADKLPALWDEFIPHLNDVSHVIADYCYGIIEQSEGNGEQLRYTACTEVSHIGTLPEGMMSVTLPPQRYARFTHKGQIDPETINNTINYIYSSWLLNSNVKHTYGADIEIYGPEFQYQSDDSIIYYAIPIEDNVDP